MARISSPARTKSTPGRGNKPAGVAAPAAEASAEPMLPPVTGKARPAKKSAKVSNARKVEAAPAAGRAKTQAKKAQATAKARAVPIGATPKPAKPEKDHKPKLVRDSFTIPKDEYAVLDAMKSRALGLEQHVRKSELLRAGIRALNAMSDGAFLKAIDAVPTLKTGRPRKG